MFIVLINYKVTNEVIDNNMAAHIEFINKHYRLGHFIASGRQVPRTGGIIFSDLKEKTELITILNEDPFIQYDLTNYEIIEFLPTKTSKELSFLMQPID